MAFLRLIVLICLATAHPAFAQGCDWASDPAGHRQHPEYVTRFQQVAPNCGAQELSYVSDMVMNYALKVRGLLSDPALLDRQIFDALTLLSPRCKRLWAPISTAPLPEAWASGCRPDTLLGVAASCLSMTTTCRGEAG
ncbi:hypothetical protein [uncultured Roseobacter sp.]|uniref:hypothetical protein n=1 Tax=uncultured Roseobacter sp. TaxID=114847 RepID=UPI00261D6F21|nr:hypothetical protein [uncultured Roseobacter sp.]